jgi:hypothetical protein
MPLPTPKEDEMQKDFMSRCMADDVMLREYPNIQQRRAVCYIQWRDN